MAGTRLEVETSGGPETEPAPHPMEILLWEAAVERLAAPASF